MISFNSNFNSIEKGDDLFNLIFELDRRLQSSQTRNSPLALLLETFGHLERILGQPINNDDVVDTIFLKLVDFFVKCNCNYKRLETSKFFSKFSDDSCDWMAKISSNNLQESLKRISSLWDQSVISDYETCNQILIFFSACSQIYFDQSTVYGIFYESFESDFLDSYKTVEVTLKYFEKLHVHLKRNVASLSESDSLIKNANFSALIIQNSKISKYFNDKELRNDAYKIILITSIISGKCSIEIPSDIKELKELINM